MSWYLAPNLETIAASIHAQLGSVTIYSIGDAKHSASVSDHNPDGKGCVHAIDVMFPVGAKASMVVRAALGRPDLKYVIHNRTIWESKNGWQARHYSGSNPHTDHVHISSIYDAKWENYRLGLLLNGVIGPATVSADVPRWPFPGETKLGSKGTAVGAVQLRFHDRGWAVGQGSHKYGNVDGKFGPKTRAMVLAFQREKGLQVDGKVGPKTWLALCNTPLT